jgi:hypothetical protein
VGVLLLHPTPSWLVPLGDDFETARTALQTLPGGYEISNYRAGLELAAAKLALASHPQRQIWLAGDQQRTGWKGVRFDRPLPPGIELHASPLIAAPKRQAAVTLLKAARTDNGRVAVEATVRSFSPGRDERTIAFFAGGERLATQTCVLTDGQARIVRSEFSVPDSNAALMLHAQIDTDELSIDDAAYAALPTVHDRRVMLANGSTGADADYLKLALQSVHGGGLPAFQVAGLPPPGAPWSPSMVAVLRGTEPFRGEGAVALEAFLAAGGAAWILCDGGPDQTAWLARQGIRLGSARPAGGRLRLRDLTLEHELFAPFAGHSIAPLLAPAFRRGWTLQGDAIEPLARWPDRTVAIAEVSLQDGRLLLTGFADTRAESTFPIEAGYVPFVHQAIRWLAGYQETVPLGGRVGETLVLPGAGTWRAVLSPKPIEPEVVRSHVTPVMPGIYAFEQPAAPRRFYAVNLDTAESDLTPWPTPADFDRLASVEKSGQPTRRGLREATVDVVTDAALVDERHAWWWLLAAAFTLLLLELAVANRTVL